MITYTIAAHGKIYSISIFGIRLNDNQIYNKNTEGN